ncbi:MAG: hypothetical protein EA398_14225 [Deltaproteobacteria bacterium]|nr:MAG: hypothetical protein EA398_14225 [Deltaproteobacteria bacterium]
MVDGVLGADGEPEPLSRPCYTGPEGTEGVGECRAGVQVCAGGEWPSACEGQVTPQPEVCDGRDNSCSGEADDSPGDVGGACDTGLPGRCAAGTWVCTDDGERVCQQNREALAVETCNNEDDTCDGIVDGTPGEEGARVPLTRPCYTGPEGTAGVGNCRAGTQTCTAGDWGSTCDGQVTPQPETCNGEDQSCNGTVDSPVPADAPLWYRDADGDGFGNPSVSLRACSQPSGYVSNNQDCDDSNPFINPNAQPRCDGARNNCQPGSEQHGCPAGCTGIYNPNTQRGYMFCQGGGRNWDSARSMCLGQSGMDLVSIHSTAEHNWVLGSAPWSWGQLWIGGRQSSPSQNVFGWSNGATWNYNGGWGSGEPNNVNEQCVEMERTRQRANGSGAGAFNDNSCGLNRNEYICAWTQWPQRP